MHDIKITTIAARIVPRNQEINFKIFFHPVDQFCLPIISRWNFNKINNTIEEAPNAKSIQFGPP